MKRHLQSAEQQVSRSNLTKYCACHAERLTFWVLITYETSFTMREATGVTINLTKYCACHTKRLTFWVLITYETSFPMRGATGVTIQPHQILRLPRKMTLQDFKENLQKQVKRHFQCGDDPRMIRPWSEQKTQTATRLVTEVTFRAHHEHFLLKNATFRAQSYIQTFTKYCACHKK